VFAREQAPSGLRRRVAGGTVVEVGTLLGTAGTQLARITERSEEIVERVENVRTLAQALTGNLDEEVRAWDFGAVLDEELASVRLRYGAAEFTVDAPEAVTVYADSNLGDVVESLLSNAVEHDDAETPRVAVAVEAHEGTVEVRVADNGSGITEEVENSLERWEPSSPTGGAGVGLALVTALVDHYGGEMWFEANEPRGSVAVLSLPRGDRVDQ